MQDGFDLSIIVFLLLAVFVGWRLYSVLGTRSGRDDQAPTSNLASVVKLVSPVAPHDATTEPVVEDVQEADPARWPPAGRPAAACWRSR